MALFEPTNFRQETAAVDALIFDKNRYVRNTPARHGFMRNEQTDRGSSALTVEPARDRYQPRNDDPFSQRNEPQPQAFDSRVQNGIDSYRANEGLINRNRLERQNTIIRNNVLSPLLSTENQTQRTTTEIQQPTGINAAISLSTQANRAIEEYRNLSTIFGATQNTLQSDADNYLRTQQAVPLGAQLLVTPSEQNQPALTVTPPPTLNLALSRGIEQYTLNSSPIEENGTVNRNTADLYISSNPTQRLMTQLLP